jgi:hypothetical protein
MSAVPTPAPSRRLIPILRAASLTNRTQLKFEVVDTFKNKPPTADIRKNDVSTLLSVIYKFQDDGHVLGG